MPSTVTGTPAGTDRRHTVVESPIGPLSLVADGAGRLVGLHMEDQAHRPDPSSLGPRREGILPEAVRQLREYFAGDRTEFDLDLVLVGTPFQEEVWAGLLRIPYGETASYGQLATAIGRPKAVRAVGLANGRNPIAVVVPCHRVIGADGSLTGYGGGMERKRWLLDHEEKIRRTR